MIVRYKDKTYEVTNAENYALTEEEMTIFLMENEWECKQRDIGFSVYQVDGFTHTGREMKTMVNECMGMPNKIVIWSIESNDLLIHKETRRIDRIKEKVEASKIGNVVSDKSYILMNPDELTWLIKEAEQVHDMKQQSILYGPIENSRGIPKHILQQVLEEGKNVKSPHKEIWELGGVRITKINGKVYVADLEHLKNPDKNIIVRFDLNQYRVVGNYSKLSPYEIGHVMANGVRVDYPGLKYTTIIGATESGKTIWIALMQDRKTITAYSTTHHDFPSVRAKVEKQIRDEIKSEWTTERHKEWKSLKFWQKLTKIFS
jgi:hypothetical protein